MFLLKTISHEAESHVFQCSNGVERRRNCFIHDFYVNFHFNHEKEKKKGAQTKALWTCYLRDSLNSLMFYRRNAMAQSIQKRCRLIKMLLSVRWCQYIVFIRKGRKKTDRTFPSFCSTRMIIFNCRFPVLCICYKITSFPKSTIMQSFQSSLRADFQIRNYLCALSLQALSRYAWHFMWRFNLH